MTKYDSYKDSGVEWIGEIPNHWEKITLKYLVETKITDGPHETPEFVDEGIPFLSVESVQDGKLDFHKKRGFITKEQHELYSKKCKPKRDDIFIVKSGSTTGKSTIVETDEEFDIWSPICIVRPIKKKITPRFTFLSVQSNYFRRFIELGWSFGTQPNIGMGVIENLRLIVPPISEQTQIVQYIDTKTNLIDTLIQKTQEKIHLLREKRTSLINHTVTKGLKPEVEMKNSGVEWIGKIPKHWGFIPLKYIMKKGKDSIKTGPFGSQLKSEDFVSEGIKVYNQRTVYDENFEQNELYIDSDKYEQLKGFEVYPGEILITSRGTIGKCTIVPEKIQKGILHPCLIRIRTEKDIIVSIYLKRYINDTTYFLETVKLESNSTTIDVIYSDTLKNLKLPIPPTHEQVQIIKFLDEQTQLIDKLIEKEVNRIELLKEYRQSLISDVVTGKIKVCN